MYLCRLELVTLESSLQPGKRSPCAEGGALLPKGVWVSARCKEGFCSLEMSWVCQLDLVGPASTVCTLLFVHIRKWGRDVDLPYSFEFLGGNLRKNTRVVFFILWGISTSAWG